MRHRSAIPLRLRLIGALAFAFAIACNAITGTGKYDLVDCPNGVCDDAGTGNDARVSTIDGATSSDTGLADTSVVLPTCGGGTAPIALTVTGAAGGSISSNPGNLVAATGMTTTGCLPVDMIRLETNGPSATWTGTSCKDGPTGNRCDFVMPASGLTMSAALP